MSAVPYSSARAGNPPAMTLSELRDRLDSVRPRNCGFAHHSMLAGELPRCGEELRSVALDCAHTNNFWFGVTLDRLVREQIITGTQRDSLKRFLNINDDALIAADEFAIDAARIYELNREGRRDGNASGDQMVRREGIAQSFDEATPDGITDFLIREQRKGAEGRVLLKRTLLRVLSLCEESSAIKRTVASRCLEHFIKTFGDRDPFREPLS